MNISSVQFKLFVAIQQLNSLFSFFRCAVWLLYGFVKSDANLICINIIGITLMVIYTVVFYLYAQKKRSVIKQAVLLLIFLMTVTEYTIVDTNYFRVKDNLGEFILPCSYYLNIFILHFFVHCLKFYTLFSFQVYQHVC